MSDEFNQSGAAAPPPGGSDASSSTKRKSSNSVVGWLIAAVVVLVLAVAGGLFTAWVVANMRAVPGPVAAASASPAPLPSHVGGFPPSATPGASAQASLAPVYTPTPSPTVEVTLPPIVYVVQTGDHLVNIANLYSVSLQDLMALNNITNPNRIQVGEQILIPGYGHLPSPKPGRTPKH